MTLRAVIAAAMREAARRLDTVEVPDTATALSLARSAETVRGWAARLDGRHEAPIDVATWAAFREFRAQRGGRFDA